MGGLAGDWCLTVPAVAGGAAHDRRLRQSAARRWWRRFRGCPLSRVRAGGRRGRHRLPRADGRHRPRRPSVGRPREPGAAEVPRPHLAWRTCPRPRHVPTHRGGRRLAPCRRADDLGSCGEHLRLQGLPPADVAVLAAHLGADADPEALHERTAGNPSWSPNCATPPWQPAPTCGWHRCRLLQLRSSATACTD